MSAPNRAALRLVRVELDKPKVSRRWQAVLLVGFYFLAVFLLVTIIKGLPE